MVGAIHGGNLPQKEHIPPPTSDSLVALGKRAREAAGSSNRQPTLIDTGGVQGSLFSGAFLPKVLDSRAAKLGSNSRGIIFSLKEGFNT